VLQETVQELFSGQLHDAGAVVVAVLVGESNRLAIVGEDSFGAEGGTINIGGQIF
jgi:hypothetical protein